MKHRQILAVLATAAVAALSLAADASATRVTAPSGTLFTGTWVGTNEGSITIHGVVDTNCDHAVIGGVFGTHGTSVTAESQLVLVLDDCDQHVEVLSEGDLIAHATSGGNATVTWSGGLVTFEYTTIFGSIHCVFGSNNSDVGVITAAPSSTGHATLHLGPALIPTTEGNAICGSTMELTGSFKITGPTGLRFD